MRSRAPAQRIARCLGGLALAALCFGAVATLERRALVYPFGPRGGAELEVFREERGDLDAVIFGSSYFAYGLDPSVIDAEVGAALGRPFRSYNLAMPGAWGLEVDHLVRTLLDDPPPRLRYAVIEAPVFRGWVRSPWRALLQRMIYWHTPRLTLAAMTSLRHESLPLAEKAELYSWHLRWFALRSGNLGTGVELFRSISGLRPEAQLAAVDRARESRGYASMNELEVLRPDGAARRHRFEAQPGVYRAAVARFDPADPGEDFDHYPVQLLESQVEFLRERGIEPVYVVAPTLNASGGFRALAATGRMPNLLYYAVPRRYPQLYDAASRWDSHHTNARGSRLWSTRFARDFVEWARGRSTAP